MPLATVISDMTYAHFDGLPDNPFWNCYNPFSGRPYLTNESPDDNLYDVVRDFVCEYGRNPRIFTNKDAIAKSIMRSTYMDEARQNFYLSGKDSGTRPFGNPSEVIEAELDHLVNLDYAAAGRILGTFSYVIRREDSDLVFVLWNNMSRESGSRIPIKKAKYSLEELLKNGSLDRQAPVTAIPRIKSILQSKERYQTQDPEGGGNLYMAIVWRELYQECVNPSTFSAPIPTPTN